VFFARDNNLVWAAEDLRIVGDEYRDEYGQPLLADFPKGKNAYVSECYNDAQDIPVLKELGLLRMGTSGFLSRLKQDLECPNSRLRTRHSTSEWHTRVVNLLIKASKDQKSHCKFVKSLSIIPLSDRRWVPPLNASIFFPTSGGIDIPTDLRLNLVDADALRNPSWKTLFSLLGVTECEPSRIFPLIESRHRKGSVTREQSVSYIQFIFWHHTELPQEGIRIELAPRDGSKWFDPKNKSEGWTYCSQANKRYSMSKIMGVSLPDELDGHIKFPDLRYYTALQKCERRNDRLGIEWFQDFAQTKITPQLGHRDSALKRSYELDYIAANHPHVLLGVLQSNWSQYQPSVTWDNAMKSAKVPILCSTQLRRLDTTFVPLPKLVTTVTRLGLDVDFGFLSELEGVKYAAAAKWEFLERFGVGMEQNVSFWLALLKHAWYQDSIESDVVFEIYSHLQKVSDADELVLLR